MILDASGLKKDAPHVPRYAAEVGKKVGSNLRREEGVPFLRRKDDVDQDVGKGLGHLRGIVSLRRPVGAFWGREE